MTITLIFVYCNILYHLIQYVFLIDIKINSIVVIFINLLICGLFNFILIFLLAFVADIYHKTPILYNCATQ